METHGTCATLVGGKIGNKIDRGKLNGARWSARCRGEIIRGDQG